jgi:hypothetical protein
MRKGILIGLLALGLLVIASYAFAADTATTDNGKGNTAQEQIRCCNHYYVDANNDGKCDTCGMLLTDLQGKGKGDCGSCSGNCGAHKHGGGN